MKWDKLTIEDFGYRSRGNWHLVKEWVQDRVDKENNMDEQLNCKRFNQLWFDLLSFIDDLNMKDVFRRTLQVDLINDRSDIKRIKVQYVKGPYIYISMRILLLP